MSKLDPKLLSAAIIGYTGQVGKLLTKHILEKGIFKRTVLIGRKVVEYDLDFYKNGEQKVVDFEKLNEHEDVFKGIDVLYCCLGTKFSDSHDTTRKVDYQYTLDSAKIAKKQGCKHVHLISAHGAHINSSIFISRIKAQIEEDLGKLDFDRVSIYRPKLIVCNRPNRSLFEAFFLITTKPIQWVAPRLVGITADSFAMAMITNTIYTNPNKIETIDNGTLHDLAKLTI